MYKRAHATSMVVMTPKTSPPHIKNYKGNKKSKRKTNPEENMANYTNYEGDEYKKHRTQANRLRMRRVGWVWSACVLGGMESGG